ncbi:hypothetical protein BB560_005114, partial [Smittium megazygosporum]
MFMNYLSDSPPPYSEVTKSPSSKHISQFPITLPIKQQVSTGNTLPLEAKKVEKVQSHVPSFSPLNSNNSSNVDIIHSLVRNVKSELEEQASSYKSVTSKISEINNLLEDLNLSSGNINTFPSLLSNAQNPAAESTTSYQSYSKSIPSLDQALHKDKDKDSLNDFNSEPEITHFPSAHQLSTSSENKSLENSDWYTKLSGMINNLVDDVDSALVTSPKNDNTLSLNLNSNQDTSSVSRSNSLSHDFLSDNGPSQINFVSPIINNQTFSSSLRITPTRNRRKTMPVFNPLDNQNLKQNKTHFKSTSFNYTEKKPIAHSIDSCSDFEADYEDNFISLDLPSKKSQRKPKTRFRKIKLSPVVINDFSRQSCFLNLDFPSDSSCTSCS